MMNKLILGGLSAVLLINGALMLGIYMGQNLEISLGKTIFAGILALMGGIGITAISVYAVTGEEEALAKLHQIDIELKTVRREQEVSHSNILKERVAQENNTKPTNPLRAHKAARMPRRYNNDIQITNA